MKYVVAASWNADGYITAMSEANTVERAEELVEIMVSEGNSQAFYDLNPGGDHHKWIADGSNIVIGAENPDNLLHKWVRFRAERNTKLTETDWTQYNDSPLTDEVKAEWTVHRQSLRDLPANTDDPTDPTWPEAPE